MKICIIGSKNIFIYKFAKYFIEKKGFEVFLISRSTKNYTSEDFSFLKTYYLKKERLLYKVINIRKIIKQTKPDVVHCFYVPMDGIAPILFFNRKYKYVCSIFGSDIYLDTNTISKRFVKGLIFKKCDWITFNSYQMKKDLLNLFPQLSVNKIKPIIWGVDFDLFNAVDPKKIQRKKLELGISDEKVILSYRGFANVYNQDIIFKSIPLVLERNKNVKFIFILGNTSLLDIQKLTSFIDPQIINKNLILIDRFLNHEELSIILNLSDIVINIPKTDMIAQSLLETMASKAIPIVSNLPVYQDILHDKENAIFLDEITEYELAKKILFTINNYDNLVSKIIPSNNNIVRQYFNFNKQTEKIISLYK